MKRTKRKYNNKRFNPAIIFGFLAITVLILTVGFSALTTNLSISALSTIRVQKDIRITDIMTAAASSSASSNWEDYNVSNINSMPESELGLTNILTILLIVIGILLILLAIAILIRLKR